ncbi:DNA polymerase III subunit beta [Paracoccus yeei]|jgi:DNA polymerase-3 subunit beta|uniref:Beta sliding clamp n=1 Tax=Paracoccus yeei TaxID=147645 RepID=A0A1V0GPP6_9RHOB|nr:DNA polymerase III subunit beta [Paracoccus yeei]ARC35780.1 DNA polymerase III subunit beta [Paracoccus yeei]ATQ54351.1 DNA polymerase III subunit beta [Paracoccus yeei]AYF01673.1 DNA polymerase III subunit beta [Paracoccus yeei]MBY0136626.1 DNA polymerase III subunit beta [Paracoccus yeei]OWJ94366.1 DNA polymerase III subunit beta [Paracoccus yeei]
MKFAIERADLVKAVAQAQSVVERRNTIPILANVLIEATAEGVSFRATDLDTEIVYRTTAQVEQPGATTVSASMLNDIARKLPDGALIQLGLDGGSQRLSVQAGRSNFSLATLPREDFPVMSASEYAANFSAPALVLRRLFDKSKFAISNEETRYYLNGVYMHVAEGADGPSLRCVATDGHRLARIDAPLPGGAADMPGVIVPRKTVAELRKLLDDDETEIAVSVSETKVRFATPMITLTSKVIDGTFPDYTRVIPSSNTRKLEVDAGDFAKAVDRVATVSSERSRAVKLSLDEDRLVLSVNAPDAGAADEELSVAYADDPLEIGFNAKYLHEIASQIERENAVFLFNGSGDAALIREGGDSTAVYVVMPMRV